MYHLLGTFCGAISAHSRYHSFVSQFSTLLHVTINPRELIAICGKEEPTLTRQLRISTRPVFYITLINYTLVYKSKLELHTEISVIFSKSKQLVFPYSYENCKRQILDLKTSHKLSSWASKLKQFIFLAPIHKQRRWSPSTQLPTSLAATAHGTLYYPPISRPQTPCQRALQSARQKRETFALIGICRQRSTTSFLVLVSQLWMALNMLWKAEARSLYLATQNMGLEIIRAIKI